MYVAEIDEILKVPMTLASFLSFFIRVQQRKRKERKNNQDKTKQTNKDKSLYWDRWLRFSRLYAGNFDTSMARSFTEKKAITEKP